jgi:hypothetical protein
MEDPSRVRGAVPTRFRRSGRLVRIRWFSAAIALLGAAACAPLPLDETESGAKPAVEVTAAAGPASAEFERAFAALRGALNDGEDDVARRVLEGILTRRPEGADLELTHGFEQILRGREIVGHLEFTLRIEDAGAGGRQRLVLEATHGGEEPILLQLPPGKLSCRRIAVDPDGFERREAQTQLIDHFSSWRIVPGERVRLPLLEYSVPMGRAMAVKESWGLELLSGEVSDPRGSAPAAHLKVLPCDQTRLASFLPTDPVEPQVLIDYLRREEIYLPPLMERAVRIPPERRREALALLLPMLEATEEGADQRMVRITPALRWLAGTKEPGVRAEAWARHIRRLLRQRGDGDNLDLPGDR